MANKQTKKRVRPTEEKTVRTRKVIHTPLDQATKTLESQKLVKNVETYQLSDFVGGQVWEVEVPENCNFQLGGTLRDLGLYIQYVENYRDTEVLYCRRISTMLRRMENLRKYEGISEYHK